MLRPMHLHNPDYQLLITKTTGMDYIAVYTSTGTSTKLNNQSTNNGTNNTDSKSNEASLAN